MALILAMGVRPSSAAFSDGHDDHGARSVVDAGRIAGRDLAYFGYKTGGQGSQFFHGHSGPEMLVLVKYNRRLLPLRHLNRNDLFPEVSFLCRPLRIIVAPQGHFVHRFAADIVQLGNKFSGMPHNIRFPLKQFQGHSLLSEDHLPGEV